MTLFGPIEELLARGLDASALRQRALAANLANVNTPGYKRMDVDFKQVLGGALRRTGHFGRRPGEGRGSLPLNVTHPRHLRPELDSVESPMRVTLEASTRMRNDGNNVDPDREMAELAENQLYFQALSQVMGSRIQRLKSAIFEGRR